MTTDQGPLTPTELTHLAQWIRHNATPGIQIDDDPRMWALHARALAHRQEISPYEPLTDRRHTEHHHEPATPAEAMVNREWQALGGEPATYDPSAAGQGRRALLMLAAILLGIAMLALILLCG